MEDSQANIRDANPYTSLLEASYRKASTEDASVLEYTPPESSTKDCDFERIEPKPCRTTPGAELDWLKTVEKVAEKRKAALIKEVNETENLLQQEEAEVMAMERTIEQRKEVLARMERFSLLMSGCDIVEKAKKLQRKVDKFSSEELQKVESSIRMHEEFMGDLAVKTRLKNKELWSHMMTKRELLQVSHTYAEEDDIKLLRTNNLKLEKHLKAQYTQHESNMKRWKTELQCLQEDVAQDEKVGAEFEEVCEALAKAKSQD